MDRALWRQERVFPNAASSRLAYTLAATALSFALACGGGKTQNEAVESPAPESTRTPGQPDPETDPEPDPEPRNQAEHSEPAKAQQMSSEDAKQLIQAQVAAHHGLAAGDIKVTIHDTDPPIPGVTLFTARQTTGRGPSRKFSMGVVHDGTVELDRDAAMRIAVNAWGYGKERTVPPAAIAQVVGLLEGTRSTPKPIITRKDLDFFQQTGRPEYAAAAFLPRETEVDGLPAVEYCNRADRPPFWIATAVIHPDGTVDVRRR